MFRSQQVPRWNLIQFMVLLLFSNHTGGLAFKSGAMNVFVRIHRPYRWLVAKRSALFMPGLRLHSTLQNDDSSTVNSKIVGKTEGYSKLPRLFVGAIPSEPTFCTNVQEIRQLLSSSKAPVQCREKAVIQLTPEQSRYLITILRWNNKRKTSDSRIRIFDQHSEWLAQVSVVGEDKRRNNPIVTVQCTEQIRTSSSASSLRQSVLCIAPPKKKERLRWLIEKTVELGVDGFVFLDTEYSEASSIAFDKVQTYVLEAVEQSERMSVPLFFSGLDEQSTSSSNNPLLLQERGSGSVLKTCALHQFLQRWEDSPIGNVLIARERLDTVPILEALQDLSRQEHPVLVMFLVGPEGGWSLAEEERMNTMEIKYRTHIRNVSLGSTILRSETAAMTAIAAHSLVK